MFNFSITARPPTAMQIAKNIRFGVARGLTETAKQGQKAVVGAVKGTFTYRHNWLPPGNKFGIRIKPAKPADLSSEVRTNAGWLYKQKLGGTITGGATNKRVFPYTYAGRTYIARPTRELRPKGSTKVLSKRLWPSNLPKSKIFVIRTRKGKLMLMQRYGPGRRDVAAMYILDEIISVKPRDAFYAPIKKVVARRLLRNMTDGVDNALRTMR